MERFFSGTFSGTIREMIVPLIVPLNVPLIVPLNFKWNVLYDSSRAYPLITGTYKNISFISCILANLLINCISCEKDVKFNYRIALISSTVRLFSNICPNFRQKKIDIQKSGSTMSCPISQLVYMPNFRAIGQSVWEKNATTQTHTHTHTQTDRLEFY